MRVEEYGLWVYLESMMYSREGSNVERQPDKGTSVGYKCAPMSHSECKRPTYWGKGHKVKGDEGRC